MKKTKLILSNNNKSKLRINIKTLKKLDIKYFLVYSTGDVCKKLTEVELKKKNYKKVQWEMLRKYFTNIVKFLFVWKSLLFSPVLKFSRMPITFLWKKNK